MTIIPMPVSGNLTEEEAAREEAAKATGGLGDIPAGIVASTRGLPPARARLARYLAWRKKVADDLARLEAGKATLSGDIEKVDAAKAAFETRLAGDLASLLDKMRAGADWALSQFGGRDVTDLSAKLEASKYQAGIAIAALAGVDAEIARAALLAETLAGRENEFISAALHEEALPLEAEYEAALEAARKALARLRGLNGPSFNGGDSFSFDAPTAGRQGTKRVWISGEAIVLARADWLKLREVWLRDPRALSSQHLKFKEGMRP